MARARTEAPEFASIEEERAWWDEHGRELDLDALPVVDITFEVRPRARLTEQITLRMSPGLMAAYRARAERRGMTASELMRQVLTEWERRVWREERAHAEGGATAP